MHVQVEDCNLFNISHMRYIVYGHEQAEIDSIVFHREAFPAPASCSFTVVPVVATGFVAG